MVTYRSYLVGVIAVTTFKMVVSADLPLDLPDDLPDYLLDDLPDDLTSDYSAYQAYEYSALEAVGYIYKISD